MRSRKVTARLLIALAAAGALAALPAGAAAAGPELGVTLNRTMTPLTHGDERTVYEVTVSNTASENPSAGEELTCSARYPNEPTTWFRVDTFSFQWLSNGVPASGPVTQPTATTSTYTVQAADEGHALQCEVLGENAFARAASFSPPVQAEPLSSPAAAVAKASAANLRPTIENEAGHLFYGLGTRTCTAPEAGAWSGPPTWSFQWLENGAPIPGATSTELTPDLDAVGKASGAAGSNTLSGLVTEEGSFEAGQKIVGKGVPPGTTITAVGSGTLTLSANLTEATSGSNYESGPDVETNFQCMTIGTTGSGEAPGGAKVVAISGSLELLFGESRPPNNNTATTVAILPFISFSHSTSGPVSVEMTLPGGRETYAWKAVGSGWSCSKAPPSESEPAKATCSRADALGPQASYPPIELIERPGRDAPDTLTTRAVATGGGAESPGSAEDSFTVGPAVPFGFQNFFTEVLDDAGAEFTQAGGHPSAVAANVQFTEHVPAGPAQAGSIGLRATNGHAKQVITDVPAGFVGNPQAVARCASAAEVVSSPPSCPEASVVGGITLEVSEGAGAFANEPVYAIEPEYGAPAQFAFGIPQLNLVYTLTAALNPAAGYSIQLVSSAIPKTPEVFASPVTLCGFGARPLIPVSTRIGELEFQGCRDSDEPGAAATPFITNPTRCEAQGPTTRIRANTWEDPGAYAEASYSLEPLSGCEKVRFEPEIEIEPTSKQADSPTGLDVTLRMPTKGLEEKEGIAQANLAGATVTLPEGMAVNPSMAAGLAACGEAQFGMHDGVPDSSPVACPESSKIGTAEVQTPLVEDTLAGNVYLAAQGDNPFGSLLALYMELGSKRDGLLLKVAGKVTPDPLTGQLTTTFMENPQAPFSELRLHFASGQRAPLINPPACGRYGIDSEIWPWTAADPAHPSAAETVKQSTSFQVARGPGGGACPAAGLDSSFTGGVEDPTAGATSPFTISLSRPDGSERFSGLDLRMPPGLAAYLKGVPYCPEAALASISAAEGTAAAQIASPACPAASQVGTVTVGAGAGSQPFFLQTGKAYLAGPYKGAPLSIAIVTPVLAGPFDLGTVVVRSALQVNLETAQVSVISDPIPTIWHGLLLDVRDIRVAIDRPRFMLAPTSCEPTAVAATVHGAGGQSEEVADRFQVGSCKSLAFKPKLALTLKGKTHRSGKPALRAVLTMPSGNANIARAQVGLPHALFLDTNNLDKVCNQARLKSATCPARSVYGHAKAWTPLLEDPLQGPVYIGVGYGHKLPDLVADLNGQIRILPHARVDTTGQNGLRNTFEVVPDAPVSRFEIALKGGPKYSLLENSEDLCARALRASVRFTAHNGRVAQLHPKIQVPGCKKRRAHHAKSHRGHGR